MSVQRWKFGAILGVVVSMIAAETFAQSVCLPLPRLLTTKPMGGQIGTTVEVTVTAENAEDVELLRFSHPGIVARPKLNEQGLPVENVFVVDIAEDCPPGLYDARIMSRLGISSPRIFSVGTLKETSPTKPNTTLEAAFPVDVNSICNATTTRQAIDHYSFEGKAGQRVLVDCSAKGIDSKLTPVVIIADSTGADLLVERRGGLLEFDVPQDGIYVVKVHDLTFNGGAEYFYRLALTESAEGSPVNRMPSTLAVNTMSWPPVGLADQAGLSEVEPNSEHPQAQKIALPCDISGSFYPAADLDCFEFEAKKGDIWWVEVASERMGRPTDPTVVVQHVSKQGEAEMRTDVVELNDIGSPVKVSSAAYAYDGPHYNAGSTDVLGKLEIKEDGIHRLMLHDAFGGTRNDPGNTYRLIVRKAQPDFALVAWAMHMELRNGDRNALSKPLALRNGVTVPLEVVVVRRDGFDGEIELFMDNLPDGVTATGLKIPAGQTKGMMLVTAKEGAPRGLSTANFYGRAAVDGAIVERPCRLATVAWPVPNHWSEIPKPRLVDEVIVSVCGVEAAPLSFAAAEDKVWEVKDGDKLTVPLKQTKRSDFSGAQMSFRTFGTGFDKNPAFDVALDGQDSQVVLDLAALKPQPGEYTIGFYGSAVAKYRYNPEAVTIAEVTLNQAKAKAAELATQSQNLAEAAKVAADEQKAEAEKSAQEAAEQTKAADAAVAAAEKTLQAVTNKAKPNDIVDIVASEPIRIRVLPKE